MNILVVEDLAIMRRVIINAVSAIDTDNIFSAADGVEALEIIKENQIDLLVTDWLMPNMDGLQLVEKIRNELGNKEMPIIMITTQDEKFNVVEAVKKGINDYVVKPFDSRVLEEKVKRMLLRFDISVGNNEDNEDNEYESSENLEKEIQEESLGSDSE